MSGVQTRLDGTTLVVRTPMRFQRRGSRKRIVAPDGVEIVPTSKPQPDGTLLKALARAWRWQCMLDDGVYATVSEIGDAENISKSYVRCGSLIAAHDARPFGGDACSCRLCGSLRGRHRFEPPHHGVQDVGAPM
jgi:hypothetical protein